jgi:hypothetical protein
LNADTQIIAIQFDQGRRMFAPDRTSLFSEQSDSQTRFWKIFTSLKRDSLHIFLGD